MIIRTIIVDDEGANRKNLNGLLTQYCPQVQIVGEAANNEDALNQINSLKPDLVFLDVRMHSGDIFTMLEKLENIRFGIIFVTAYDEYAFKAFQFNALDYLLKPLNIKKLIVSVDKATKSISLQDENERLRNLVDNQKRNEQDKRIAIPQDDKIDFIPIRQIIRCQAESNYTRFILENKKEILVSRTLKDFDIALESCGFIRTHQSHLVNLNHVQSIIRRDGGFLKMSDGSSVPISKPRREELERRMADPIIKLRSS